MKLITRLLWTFPLLYLLHSSPSFGYPCPKEMLTDSSGAVLFQWLDRFKGVMELPGCRVEITVCNPQEKETLNNQIGEIYILDDNQREAYLPIILTDANNSKIKTKVRFGRKYLNYFKKDLFFEEELGRTEAYRLEFELTEDASSLKGLDLGVYATRKQLNQPNGNDSLWFNCGG